MAEQFTPADPGYSERVHASFARQAVMRLIGARMTRVEPGLVELELPFREDLTQQHGFFHAGITSTIADSAGGYAGYTLFRPDTSVLTVEFKISLLAPAEGDLLRATGRVIKPGRTLAVCQLDVFARKNGRDKHCATGLQTLAVVSSRPDILTPG